MTITPTELERIRDALTRVEDPELGLDIVTLGLVYRVEATGGDTVVLEMTLTTPGCPVSEWLPDLAALAAASALGPERPVEVDLRVVWDPPWTPERIDPDALARLTGRA